MNQFEQKPVNVVNGLTSDSTTDVLSAAQGKALNSKIGKTTNLGNAATYIE